MARRFNREMREALAQGVSMEWRNGSHWHSAEVTGPIKVDSLGDQYVPIKHRGRTTKTVAYGQELRGYPRSLRVSR